MIRRPAFWVAFVVCSLTAAAFAAVYFPRAFPTVSLDLAMDRASALRAARELAAAHRLGPSDYRTAASFTLESDAQTFVELEGGGKDAFSRMLKDGTYAPYSWQVRHFKEGEANETLFRFTPDGKSYGFVEKIKEDAPGPSLEAAAARAIAEDKATNSWRVNLGAYTLLEQSQELRSVGRRDHTFVYERQDRRLGEGQYRVRLVVSGDRLTEVTHFIKIPEAFSRRYQQMRSANDAIATTAHVAALVLFLIGGGVIGLFFLLRQGWVIWRQPVLWGLLVAVLQVLVMINQWPLEWMTYDTAVPVQSYMGQRIAILIAAFFGLGLQFALSFMAAESLTRRAFPHHPQLWRVWRRDVASSKPIVGATVAGYLLVGLFFAYETGLYFLTHRVLGWWTPSDALLHPDVLATYVPWLSAIAISFQAGFWEEALFRAVPIAGAVLIGERFNRRRTALVIGFVVQALIFSAGHANYPNQPSYARVVELILPSVMFGLIYVRYGLLPGIILHFAFDVVWFAIPLFVATAPGIRIDQTMVVLLTLVPLWVVLWSLWRGGRWRELHPSNLNGAWEPPKDLAPTDVAIPHAPVPTVFAANTVWMVMIAGGVGLAAWLLLSSFERRLPSFTTARTDAVRVARKALEDRRVSLKGQWHFLPTVDATVDQQDRFVWQTAGRDAYWSLVGRYLAAPRWHVRVATFEGDVAERAEEWQVFIEPDGSLSRVRHRLPEARPGATLTEQDARQLARLTVERQFGLIAANLKEVSAEPARRVARGDWTFTFAEQTSRLPKGELRIGVQIAGDEVTDAYRYVHVPEEWGRQERGRQGLVTIVRTVGLLLLGLLLLGGAITAVVWWSRRTFSTRVFLGILAVMGVVSVVSFINEFAAVLARLETAQPLRLQLIIAGGVALVGLLIWSAMTALLGGLVAQWSWKRVEFERYIPVAIGASLGALAAALAAVGGITGVAQAPEWPSYSGAARFVPWLGAFIGPVPRYISMTVVVMLVLGLVDLVTAAWTRRHLLGSVFFLVAGLVFSGAGVESISTWALTGVVYGALLTTVYVTVLRFNLALTPLAVAAMTALGMLKEGLYRAYPGALTGAILGVAFLMLLSWVWYRVLCRVEAAAVESR